MRRYFLTGCTGFLGRAIIADLLSRPDTEHICLMTRWQQVSTNPRISFHVGDIVESPLPGAEFTHIIHGANGSHATDPALCYYTIVEGTRRIADWASGNAEILYLSSGGVHRETPYGRGKRLAEKLLPYRAKIARIYTLVGPDTPTHYAVGEFIRQALMEGRIRVTGGENIVRSYLHVDDAARWVLRVLDDGYPSTPYDIGGDSPWTVRSVAVAVANVFQVPLEAYGSSSQADSYLPDVAATKRLGLKSTISLTQALERIRAKH